MSNIKQSLKMILEGTFDNTDIFLTENYNLVNSPQRYKEQNQKIRERITQLEKRKHEIEADPSKSKHSDHNIEVIRIETEIHKLREHLEVGEGGVAINAHHTPYEQR